MKSAFKADSIIQRDALLSALHNNGITAQSPPRDLSRKFTDTTVDISYEGYSVFFDGFDIQVPDQDLEKAQEIISQFLRQTNVGLAQEKTPPRYLQKFYFCSLFSGVLPILFHILALYYLFLGLKSGEKLSFGKTLFSVLFQLAGIGLIYLSVRSNT